MLGGEEKGSGREIEDPDAFCRGLIVVDATGFSAEGGSAVPTVSGQAGGEPTTSAL